MSVARERALSLIDQFQGTIPLQPTYVRRFYPDGGRLGISDRPGGTFNSAERNFTPERWIVSTVPATNPTPRQNEGLSLLRLDGGETVSLRDLIAAAPAETLGEERARAHEGEFRVLTKILDPGEPIVFHLHASDREVAADPNRFAPHRFGKDEAYHYLTRPKGVNPYNHLGLFPGVTREELVAAVERGPDHALELSPALYQRFGEGFLTPAGVPHRPGTALTLEIQQPSDVYTLLETHAAGQRMSPEQIHPGFASLDEAFGLVDMSTSQDPDLLERNYLRPEVCEGGRQAGGVAEWIVPPRLTRKFSAKRLTVTGTVECMEASPHALFIWEGNGSLDGRPVRAGEEYFVTDAAARRSRRLRATEGTLVAFAIFPAEVES